jgi:hypothetical protein
VTISRLVCHGPRRYRNRKRIYRLISRPASGVNAGSTLKAHLLFKRRPAAGLGGSFVKWRVALVVLVGTWAAATARAETRIFLVDSSDGYGIDRCLAAGEPCGAAAAAALCQAREYAKAIDFGRINPAEVTGGVPAGSEIKACRGRACSDMVAITCSR